VDKHYRKLALTLAINTALMFVITYTMIDRLEHFYVNLNRVYMALMMVAPMAIVMLVSMRSMYSNKRLNLLLHSGFAGLLLAAFALARTQTPIGDEQFLRAMIPHHSSAILMCEQASIKDPEIVELCKDIVAAQEREISQMKSILDRY